MTESPTLIAQSGSIEDPSVNRVLSVFPVDSDGDVLIQIQEGESLSGLYLDPRGVTVLRQALAEPTVERDSNPDVRAVAEAVGELEPDLDFNETQISIAIHFERAIEFAYDKGSGVIEQRKLFPKVSYAAPNGIVVTGDDIDRQDVRAFRVDRIQGEVKVV